MKKLATHHYSIHGCDEKGWTLNRYKYVVDEKKPKERLVTTTDWNKPKNFNSFDELYNFMLKEE